MPPLLDRIAEDPLLHGAKIIAEAWDAGGAYQVGSFGGPEWAEWNDQYRDDIRSFWKGDRAKISHFAARISGSSDIYAFSGRKPAHSINFVTAHDGFTMHDLVSYNTKHNASNGEENRDGSDNNLSCNWGYEGETGDKSIQKMRFRTIRNFWASLLVSSGTPMILGGDEFARTQRGNNNAYCQDNEISWFDYSLLTANADLFRFACGIIAFRRAHPTLQRLDYYSGESHPGASSPDIQWLDEHGNSVDWARQDNVLAMVIDGSSANTMYATSDVSIAAFFNATPNAVEFTVPPLPSPGAGKWLRALDTSLEPPDDIAEPGAEAPTPANVPYKLDCWSMAVLISQSQLSLLLCLWKNSAIDQQKIF